MPTLASLIRRLERKGDEAGGLLDGAIAAIDRAPSPDEAARALEAAAAAAGADPRALEAAEERLPSAASRKHGVPIDDLPALAARMADELAALNRARAAGRAPHCRRRREAPLRRSRRGPHDRRKKAAKLLERAVAAELPALKLDRAELTVAVEADPARASEAGIDEVAFMVRTNPGSRPGPIMKVASGGELARFLLALKVALADRGSAPTLVFDEIDTAVGGAVADAIGARLARLSGRVQVLSVTHAPQVAAGGGPSPRCQERDKRRQRGSHHRYAPR